MLEIPDAKKMNNERYFQIRDVDSEGCGSFISFCVKENTSNEDIYKEAAELQTNAMNRREEMFIPSMFRQPPKWRNTIKVVEQKRTIRQLEEVNERTGRDYTNDWNTLRGGLKFTIYNSFIEVTMSDGKKYRGDGYEFGKII